MPKIKIDATALEPTWFTIPEHESPIMHNATVIQELDMAVRSYSYRIGSSFDCDFVFSVTSNGKIAYDPKFSSFLEGAGTTTLKLNGFPVTLDARYLPAPGLKFANITSKIDFTQFRHCRLLPASGYQVQQGSGIVCDSSFSLDGQGHFKYDDALDIASGGPMRGAGTATLEFLGLPIVVDARPAGGSFLIVNPIQMPLSPSVVLLNLLPAKFFRIQLESGMVTQAGFDLDRSGKITLRDELPLKMKADTFHGVTRVTALRFLLPPLEAILE